MPGGVDRGAPFLGGSAPLDCATSRWMRIQDEEATSRAWSGCCANEMSNRYFCFPVIILAAFTIASMALFYFWVKKTTGLFAPPTQATSPLTVSVGAAPDDEGLEVAQAAPVGIVAAGSPAPRGLGNADVGSPVLRRMHGVNIVTPDRVELPARPRRIVHGSNIVTP